MTKSIVVEAARVVAQLCAFVGVVAGFWHVLWIAGVGCWQVGWWGRRCSRWATGAWNGIACWHGDQQPTPQEGEESGDTEA